MSRTHSPLHLYDPAAGHASLTVSEIELKSGGVLRDRTNYFSLCLIHSGCGEFFVDAACHAFAARSLLCFSPYQNHQIQAESPSKATVVRFHANFLCIETYHDEIGCNGVLFNDVYGVPAVELGDPGYAETAELFSRIRSELRDDELAKTELLLSYLKVLLIKLSRLKLEQQAGQDRVFATRLPPELEKLRELVEANYTRLHAPADYARLLHVEPKTLGKVVKTHLHKTLTELIRERILKHAKWDLLHTLKPVKQIARELGYTDELYFSRLFKRSTGCSPTFFREFETTVRGGRNLSMTSPQSSIPGVSASGDTVGDSRSMNPA